MYLEALVEIVEALTAAAGPGRALHVLGLAHPFAPPDGVTDYDSQVRLLAHLESQKRRPDKELKELTLSSLQSAEKFLVDFRSERIRQAKLSFNAAIAFIFLGGVAVLVGVFLMFSEQIAKGAVSSAAGILSGVASRPFFKQARDANDRLDKVRAGMAKLESVRTSIEKSKSQRVDN